jgi:adenylate kinase family enzyme
MLKAQQYLRSGKTLKDLEIEHGVYANISNGRLCLNYDQLEAKDDDPIACECRGLVLREDNFDIISCGMFRFFNMGQGFAANIDWSSAAFIEKMDGTCILVSKDPFTDTWKCNTRGRAEADGNIDGGELTFKRLVDSTCAEMLQKAYPVILWDRFPDLNSFMQYIDAKENYTYVFELTSPFNRIVCKYDDCRLTLLAVRNNLTLKEEDPKLHIKDFEGLIQTPKEYHFNNIEEMLEVIKSWNPSEHEGVVVRDKYFNRIKVKNPAYLAYNHMRDSLSSSVRGCVAAILLGKDDDLLPMMPELIQKRIFKYKELINKVFIQTQKDYEELKNIHDMKEFAIQAKQKLWDACLFALKRGKSPDIKTYALGRLSSNEIPQNSLDKIIELCEKVENGYND